MRMLTRRLQILLDERQYERLAAYAREQNLSVGAAVREAIERAVPATAVERAAAAGRILGAEPMSVPDPAGLRRELDELRGRRG
ncbi:MAG: antitoxin [Thermoleophilia bacterium]|nr:antitoxin [Thermoleophilia bacterium]